MTVQSERFRVSELGQVQLNLATGRMFEWNECFPICSGDRTFPFADKTVKPAGSTIHNIIEL